VLVTPQLNKRPLPTKCVHLTEFLNKQKPTRTKL